ncbi:hypothetical protein BGX38DRAFT_1172226 [Terfezia claveryi]|nr:hypothetical protein BGX38DRAFT_1172226 [Terfezia claveryi]
MRYRRGTLFLSTVPIAPKSPPSLLLILSSLSLVRGWWTCSRHRDGLHFPLKNSLCPSNPSEDAILSDTLH